MWYYNIMEFSSQWYKNRGMGMGALTKYVYDSCSYVIIRVGCPLKYILTKNVYKQFGVYFFWVKNIISY